jgi:3-oxoacyl-[acyl-carrier-protein] synthase II
MKRRVVITGMGTITPVGLNVNEFWSSLVAGKGGVGRITRFDASAFSTQIAAEVKGFDPSSIIDRKELRRQDRFVHYAIAAAHEALVDSKLELDKEDRDRIGVLVGSGIGGTETWEAQFQKLRDFGPDRISPFFVPMMIIDMASGEISIRWNLKGPNFATVSACATSAHAIGESFLIIARGDADIMITGGSEAAITPLSMAGFCSMRALSRRNDAPEKASRPFDLSRDGFVMGEGSGILVLEEMERARARGVRIYAELAGYGATADAYHMTAPAPGGEGAARAMRAALSSAGMSPEEVGYVNAHGTSTDLNDKYETMAIKTVFGSHVSKLAISSTKSLTGHLLGAAGVIETIATAKTLVEGIVHPTINYEIPDPECDLDYVPNKARKLAVTAAISNSFGFGGHNVCLALKRYQG